ncbi:uncharacterized protein BXZ73DRAFT_47214 [Epithele typhae]|uniref:uncharacterized protein n=1 Tax=Epithele typhae TaxID=378194 RepID=UPI002007BF1B|nr:uncharacterized protein BXZ73DRAFT_47214 [Epithele typhae]KAH9931675.1 hypothetical protein BXZ73DRAFT_47214 [Epithele typhae]
MTNSFLNDGMLMLSIPGPSRDPTYYIHDGNSVLLVENTLFKVHRSVLTKDKSAFETMFQLSAETDSARSDSSMTVAQEGESDDNPIRLQGDTADEFRALLWALYSLPHELSVAMSADANSTQLANLVRITHKYQFRSIMTWALSALHAYCSRPGAFDDILTTTSSAPTPPIPVNHPPTLPGIPSTSTSSPPTLEQLTELAALCERGDLLDATLTRWKRLIGEGRDLALAVTIGERFNLRPIVGLAYHALMLRGQGAWAPLTRAQRVRILAGFYALSKLWDALPGQAPPLTHTARCTSQQRCAKAWGALWRTVLETGTQVMPGLAREDVLGKTMLAESMMKALVDREIPSQGFLDGMPHCRESALLATSMRVREIKESLADYFSDEF